MVNISYSPFEQSLLDRILELEVRVEYLYQDKLGGTLTIAEIKQLFSERLQEKKCLDGSTYLVKGEQQITTILKERTKYEQTTTN